MSTKDLVDIGQFILNCFLAFFTMRLFFQGQRDRRRVEEDRRREQAAKVSALINQPKIKSVGKTESDTTWQTVASYLEIYNDSDTGITGVKVFHQLPSSAQPTWDWEDAPQYEWRLLDLLDDPVPTVLPYLGGGEVERVDCGARQLSSHSLELHFTDGAGLSWVRTLQDGKLWPNHQLPDCWWSIWYQRISLIPGIGKAVKFPIWYAQWRLQKTAPRIPLSARFARFLWGHAPAPGAEPEPWRRPIGFPARDWPYESMVWWAKFQRAKPDRDLEPDESNF
ncbi:hypothetical protein [Paenarthrobacter histidinolovorans]|uniref:hypothetical protein n=1 Tax=Paenarthrobacter histidinolovorans TaxID=43664 RepID=UPI001668DF78|nr:hypothetical protein [Paenarthrobacter histidinolovorans]GGJ21461.1 hypothetical protein GCM10010052_18350 [Paenarthrobacter histidinolovorans]